MKRFVLTPSIIVAVMILIGADIRRSSAETKLAVPQKKRCMGYTIIEYGKGIDCNGDTVKLARVNGVQTLVN
jgi:hypothetical protein